MEEIATEILTHLVSKLLQTHGLPVPKVVVRKVIALLVANGLEYAEVAADAVKQLGHGELSKLARAEARGATVRIRCPVLDEDVDR